MKINKFTLLSSLLTITCCLSFAEERTTPSDTATLRVFEGNRHIYMLPGTGTNLSEYFSGNPKKKNRIISFFKFEETLNENYYGISAAQTHIKVDADTIKRKKEKLKEKKILKKHRAEEKILTNKRRKAEDFINFIRQAEKNKRLQEADQYFENYVVKITKKRKEFINQLNANPVSILKDHPEEEKLKDEAAVKIGVAKTLN